MTTTHTGYTHTGATSSVADLLRRAGNGDQAAWEEILLRHGKRVFATVRSFRLQEADALDAVQMTWLRLTEHAHQIRDPEQLGGGWPPPRAANVSASCAMLSAPRAHVTRRSKRWLIPSLVPNSGSLTPTSPGDFGTSSASCRPAGRPCCGHCSPTTPAPTLRSLAAAESRPAGSDPPGREPWRSFGTKFEQHGFRPVPRPCSSSTLLPLSATIQGWVPACRR